LLFASYQVDITRQFIPIQKRLAEGDLLNEWTEVPRTFRTLAQL
jgi:dye decolorizing peroxidase